MSSILEVIEVVTTRILPAGEQENITDRDLQTACLFLALGEPTDTVAKKLKIPFATLDSFIRSDAGITMLVRIQTGLFPDPKQRLKRLQNMAIDTQIKLLKTGSEGVAAKVADSILDRGGGKAVQMNEDRSVVTVADLTAADRMLDVQKIKLQRLEELRDKLISARGKK